MSEYVAETRFKLDEAKFFYEQMKSNLQDRAKFLYFLDAFLSAARAVTFVFQKARGKVDEFIIKWYDNKVYEWKNDKVMRFFIEIRNISVKEHAPKMQTTAAADFTISLTIGESLIIKKISPGGKVEERTVSPIEKDQKPSNQQTSSTTRIVNYSFHELPKGFDEDPDVMRLCAKYLDILEEFVAEAECLIGKKK